jgi:hypothetical protein
MNGETPLMISSLVMPDTPQTTIEHDAPRGRDPSDRVVNDEQHDEIHRINAGLLDNRHQDSSKLTCSVSADQAAAVTENLLLSTVVRRMAANVLISSSLSEP